MRERLHLDRRASLLAKVGEESGSGDAILTTPELASWLCVSKQWCEIGRNKGYGPPFIKIAGKIRYLRSDVINWLNERTHRCTSEYRPFDRSEPAPADPAQDVAD